LTVRDSLHAGSRVRRNPLGGGDVASGDRLNPVWAPLSDPWRWCTAHLSRAIRPPRERLSVRRVVLENAFRGVPSRLLLGASTAHGGYLRWSGGVRADRVAFAGPTSCRSRALHGSVRPPPRRGGHHVLEPRRGCLADRAYADYGTRSLSSSGG